MESREEFDVVTGSFGYTGKYVTQRLLAAGRTVRTLTSRPQSDSPFGAAVQADPFHFDQPAKLTEALRGARTVYNTYWVRFCHGRTTFDTAVENTRTLIRCAREAGVKRFVHVSITHASADSPLPYFQGKGILEETIKQSGLSYAIVRPAVVFGPEDILINNIAWLLRKLPIFGIPGSGEYRLQPILVDDLADIMVGAGASHANTIVDAVGPDIFTFEEMVRLIRDRIGGRAHILHMHPGLALLIARVLGRVVGDVMLTKEELDGLMSSLLISNHPATGTVRLGDWLADHAAGLGSRYSSELRRHYSTSPVH
ncbi:MAG: NAD(P)H-binding protein [Planctomycetes bacterium]|nr:NAD(P)H-binding protein [Planctomycetota bacterium]